MINDDCSFLWTVGVLRLVHYGQSQAWKKDESWALGLRPILWIYRACFQEKHLLKLKNQTEPWDTFPTDDDNCVPKDTISKSEYRHQILFLEHLCNVYVVKNKMEIKSCCSTSLF